MRLLALSLSITYFLGLISFGSIALPTHVTKIKITHTHRVDLHDHDHDHDYNHDSNEHQHHQHTHEILVMGSVFYLPVAQTPVVHYIEAATGFPEPATQNPPVEPALNSIFRPPIA